MRGDGFAETWDRYALVAKLGSRLGTDGSLGKKKLQKLVYILQQLEGVSAGFRFRFFTYGPFSDDLAVSLDVAERMGGVRVDYDPGANAYQISGGSKAGSVIGNGQEFLQTHEEAINRVLERFGDRTAMELELIATIVYLLEENGQMGSDEMIKRVIELKPKYDRQRVSRAIGELSKYGYLKLT